MRYAVCNRYVCTFFCIFIWTSTCLPWHGGVTWTEWIWASCTKDTMQITKAARIFGFPCWTKLPHVVTCSCFNRRVYKIMKCNELHDTLTTMTQGDFPNWGSPGGSEDRFRPLFDGQKTRKTATYAIETGRYSALTGNDEGGGCLRCAENSTAMAHLTCFKGVKSWVPTSSPQLPSNDFAAKLPSPVDAWYHPHVHAPAIGGREHPIGFRAYIIFWVGSD